MNQFRSTHNASLKPPSNENFEITEKFSVLTNEMRSFSNAVKSQVVLYSHII